ncbi:Spy/CpxP family protein refolding chaperone [Variovorax terrae]|uniref:Spy/CpxP family protein refolding chaperone n=1 Tax=Variovorax terrae TaxID=2923278 RepID=A0A9X2APH8_9BURK|nr:Spy/CpxP family protein refolding chaperone [Variovorax terrae]MCJ0763522.1 Spy/CpxP family protein refolding chaperone [Variovorax terrae]
MTTPRSTRPLFVAATLALCASQVLAQFSSGMGGMGGRRGRSADTSSSARPSDASAAPGSRAQQTVDKLYDLRMRLLITPEQAPAWESFYARTLAWANEAANGRRTSAVAEQSALQAVQLRLSETQNRYALMEDLADAAKKLYAQLTPEQQRTADQYLPPVIP